MLDREKVEQWLADKPVYQYAWFDSSEVEFSERVRYVCETECPMYNTSWACPPNVGTVEECKARCLSYPSALLVTTVTEVEDIANIAETLATRGAHEALTHEITDYLRSLDQDVLTLSTESCAICAHCTCPDAPCRHPDRMFPCVESHGILATNLAEKLGIDFFNGNIVTWFSMLFYRDRK